MKAPTGVMYEIRDADEHTIESCNARKGACKVRISNKHGSWMEVSYDPGLKKFVVRTSDYMTISPEVSNKLLVQVNEAP